MRTRSDETPPFVVELVDDEPDIEPVVVEPRGSRLAPLAAAALVVVIAAAAGSAVWSPAPSRPPAPDPVGFEEELTGRLPRCDASAPDGDRACVRWATPGTAIGTASGLLFTADAMALQSRDPVTGGVGWSRGFDGAASVTAGGSVVVAAERAVPERMLLLAFDAESGGPLWQTTVGGTFGRPVIGAGLVLVHDRERLIAFAEREPVRRWELDLPAGMSAPPLAVDDLVVIGTNDGVVTAVHAATGAVRWQTTLPARLRHPPVALDDAVVVATATGLVGLERETGRTRWTRRPAYPPGWLAAVGDVVVVEAGPSLVGLDDDHGGERWRTRLAAVPVGEVAGDGVVFLAVNRTLVAVGTTDGRVRWRERMFGQWPVALAAAAGQVLFAGIDGEVVAIS